KEAVGAEIDHFLAVDPDGPGRTDLIDDEVFQVVGGKQLREVFDEAAQSVLAQGVGKLLHRRIGHGTPSNNVSEERSRPCPVKRRPTKEPERYKMWRSRAIPLARFASKVRQGREPMLTEKRRYAHTTGRSVLGCPDRRRVPMEEFPRMGLFPSLPDRCITTVLGL